MSEYQYYEFRAIDRPLTERQMSELRELSTRAEITPTSFTNEYHWGDFRGNPRSMMEKYFDAFLYYANWGTHWFMLRLPAKLADLKAMRQFGGGDSLTIRTKAGHVLLEFQSEDESGDWEDEGDSGWLSSLVSLRADLLRGDLRCLYLGWLASVQANAIEGDRGEPPLPPGLKRLSSPLKAFADFLRIDDKLLKAAAALEPGDAPAHPSRPDLSRWINSLPIAEKNKILLNLAEGDALHLRETLLQRFRKADETKKRPRGVKPKAPARRTAGDLLASAGLQ